MMDKKCLQLLLLAFLLGAIVLGLFGEEATAYHGTATNIRALNYSSPEHWAWSDLTGWIDFHSDSVMVQTDRLEGYASSSLGDVSLHCNSTRNGNICGTSNYGVLNDGAGRLSGYGWNDAVGWVSFWCGNPNGGDCGTSPYRVSVDPISGYFQGWAWNDLAGWVDVNSAPSYWVEANWQPVAASGTLISLTYDTGVPGGAKINSIIWRGKDLGAGPQEARVEFQIAASQDSTGPWTPSDFIGPGGLSTQTFSSVKVRDIDPVRGISEYVVKIDYTLFTNQRYFRYKVLLLSDQGQSRSPRIDEIIVNWSP